MIFLAFSWDLLTGFAGLILQVNYTVMTVVNAPEFGSVSLFCFVFLRCVPVSLLLQALCHVGVVTLQLALHVLDGFLHVCLAGLDLLQALQQRVPRAVHVMVVVVVPVQSWTPHGWS